MGSELSATLRLGITISVLSAFTILTVNIFLTCTSMLESFSNRVEVAYQGADEATMMSFNMTKAVGAPTVYKILATEEDRIKEVVITYSDGTRAYDYKDLLKKADKQVQVFVTMDREGKYVVAVTEVD